MGASCTLAEDNCMPEISGGKIGHRTLVADSSADGENLLCKWYVVRCRFCGKQGKVRLPVRVRQERQDQLQRIKIMISFGKYD